MYFWSLAYFRFLEALNSAFEVQYFCRASVLHLIEDTDSM